METHGYNAQIKESVILQKNSHYTVLRKNISDEIKDEFNRIVKEMKADGTITALLKKYY